jgi:hypothetical protein
VFDCFALFVHTTIENKGAKMKTLALAILLSFFSPQVDTTKQAPKQKIVAVDTTKTVEATPVKKSLPTATILGSIVALLLLYVIFGPKNK